MELTQPFRLLSRDHCPWDVVTYRRRNAFRPRTGGRDAVVDLRIGVLYILRPLPCFLLYPTSHQEESEHSLSSGCHRQWKSPTPANNTPTWPSSARASANRTAHPSIAAVQGPAQCGPVQQASSALLRSLRLTAPRSPVSPHPCDLNSAHCDVVTVSQPPGLLPIAFTASQVTSRVAQQQQQQQQQPKPEQEVLQNHTTTAQYSRCAQRQ